ESLDDRTKGADVIDDDRGDDLPGYDETDCVADAEPRREKRDGYQLDGNNESTKVAIGRHVPQRLQRRKRYTYDDRPGCNDDEADRKEGERRDHNTAGHATHRRVRGSLNGN